MLKGLSKMNSMCFIDKLLVFSTDLVAVLLKNYWNIPERSHIVFSDFLWLTELAYVPDIFRHLHRLSRSLQGKTINEFIVWIRYE